MKRVDQTGTGDVPVEVPEDVFTRKLRESRSGTDAREEDALDRETQALEQVVAPQAGSAPRHCALGLRFPKAGATLQGQEPGSFARRQGLAPR
jgi:hypothetical protein